MSLYSFTVNVCLSTEEVVRRLQTITRPPPRFPEFVGNTISFDNSDPRPFLGEVHADTFCLRRHIHSPNSFLPRVRGRISATASGSRVRVTMSLRPFTAVVLGCVFAIFGATVTKVIQHPNGAGASAALVGIVMLILFAAGPSIGFVSEVIRARRLLLGVLSDAQPDSEQEKHVTP